MREYKFRDATQVISYIRYKNPARQKSVNLLEADFSGGSSAQDDSTDWCIITKKTFKVLRSFTGRDEPKRLAFEWYYFAPDSPNVVDIARAFGKNKSTIWRWLNEISSELTRTYRALDIMPPADNWELEDDAPRG